MHKSILKSIPALFLLLVPVLVAQPVSDSSLIAYWPFESGLKGVVSTDESPYRHDILITDGASNTSSLPGGAYGFYAILSGGGFDGEYKTVIRESCGKFNSPAFTFSAFTFCERTDSVQTIIQNSAIISNVFAGYVVQIAKGGALQVVFFDSASGGKSTNIMTKAVIQKNVMTHIAVSYDGTNLYTYINGVLKDVCPYNEGFTPGAGPAIFGATVINGRYSNIFKNKIDEIRVYNRVLNASEILQLTLPLSVSGNWEIIQYDSSNTHTYKGALHLIQSSEGAIIGTAAFPGVDSTSEGTVTGSFIQGRRQVILNITWQNGKVGKYTADLSVNELTLSNGNATSTHYTSEMWRATKILSIPSITGCWNITQRGAQVQYGVLQINQNENEITGTATFSGNSAPVTGIVNGNQIDLDLNWGTLVGHYRGIVSVDGLSITNGITNSYGYDPENWSAVLTICQ